MLEEAFFYRTDEPLDNLIQSFKNLFLNLKYAIDERHRIEFFSSNVKKDLETYKEHLLLYYDTKSQKEFATKFKSLIDEIDYDLIKDLAIDSFINSILHVFEDKKSMDRAKVKIEKTFEEYMSKLDKRVKSLFSNFQTKLSENEFYEPLKNINIATSGVTLEEFMKQRYLLQIELLKLEEWARENGKKILVLFEGRDAAGKGSTIKMFTENMDPKSFRVETFGIPTEHDKEHWFGRYKEKMPKNGEIVFFDRSWYNRAYLEPVMNYCTKQQYIDFMSSVNSFEQDLKDDGIEVIKLWFSVSKDTQKLRFELRKSNPLRYWKFSANDASTIDRWDEFTEFINRMFRHTSTKTCPWITIDSNDERDSKIKAIKKVLKRFNYDERDHSVITESKKSKKEKYVFLDIDGVIMTFSSPQVVNHREFMDNKNWSKNAIKNIQKLIDKTDSRVVITSTYRKIKTKKEIQDRFHEMGLNIQVYDFTSVTPNLKRGEDIEKYIKDNDVKDFVIIDDQKHDFAKLFKNAVVKVQTNVGFDKENLETALSILDDKKGVLKEMVKRTLFELEQSEEEKTRLANLDYMQANVKELFEFVTNEIPEYYLEEAGIEIILDFLVVEDSSNFRIQHGMVTPGTVTFKNPEPKRGDEPEIDYILRINKIPYSWKEIKGRLVQYFIRRMQANVPRDHRFEDMSEVWSFLKTYEQKFMYDYMIPMSKMAEKRK